MTQENNTNLKAEIDYALHNLNGKLVYINDDIKSVRDRLDTLERNKNDINKQFSYLQGLLNSILNN